MLDKLVYVRLCKKCLKQTAICMDEPTLAEDIAELVIEALQYGNPVERVPLHIGNSAQWCQCKETKDEQLIEDRAILNFLSMDMISSDAGYDCCTVYASDFDGNRDICTRTNMRQAVIALAQHLYGDEWIKIMNKHAQRQGYENLNEPEGMNKWIGPIHQTVDIVALQETKDKQLTAVVKDRDRYLNLWREELFNRLKRDHQDVTPLFFTHIKEAIRILFHRKIKKS